MFSAVCILSLAALSMAAPAPRDSVPTPCCGPEQWEGYAGLQGFTITAGKPIFFEGDEKVSVDAKLQRIAVNMTITSMGTVVKQKVLQDFKEKKSYLIKDGNCTTSELIGDFSGQCVPKNATFVGSATLGSGKESFGVNFWTVLLNGSRNINLSVSTTVAQCIPVTYSVFGESGGVQSMMGLVYTNVTKGIKDMSVFDVPAICAGKLKFQAFELKGVTQKMVDMFR